MGIFAYEDIRWDILRFSASALVLKSHSLMWPRFVQGPSESSFESRFSDFLIDSLVRCQFVGSQSFNVPLNSKVRHPIEIGLNVDTPRSDWVFIHRVPRRSVRQLSAPSRGVSIQSPKILAQKFVLWTASLGQISVTWHKLHSVIWQ
jgi:hypothetical protein